MKARKKIYAIIVFYVIAVSLRYLTDRTGLLSGLDSVFLIILLKGAGPAIGALVAVKMFHIKFSMSFKGNYANLIIPLSIYWLIPIVLIGVVSYFTKGTFPIIGIFSILIYGLLEEIGWRGFLQPQLASLPKFVGILVITVLWFVWHLNFDLTVSNLIFFCILLLGSWGIGLVANHTKSLLAVAAFHSLNNFFSGIDMLKVIITVILIITWILAVAYRDKSRQINSKTL